MILINIYTQAGAVTGDRVWRMPLFKYYTSLMTKSALADLNNIGGGREAGSCTAAAFLQVCNSTTLHNKYTRNIKSFKNDKLCL